MLRPAVFLLGLVLGFYLNSSPLAAEAQQVAKFARIGVITPTLEPNNRIFEAFRQGLQQQGWIEGRNIALEHRSAEGRLERLPDIAAEMVNLKVDVVVASGNPTIVALKRATRTIPIVMTVVADPVGLGYVASLARPGGNITGLTNVAEGLVAKHVEMLREINPRISRIAVLRMATNVAHPMVWRESEAAAKQLKLVPLAVDVKDADSFEAAFQSMVRGRADAVVVLPDQTATARRAQIAELAVRHRLAMIWWNSDFPEVGGLVSYGPNSAEIWHRAAYYVDRLLKGAKPGDLPIEQPTKFELVINMKTAKALGLKIPQSILLRAVRVVE